MTGRVRAALGSSAAAVALTLGGCSLSGGDDTREAAPASASAPRGDIEDCSSRSLADFPGAFKDRANVVVGPLVLVGAAFTPTETVRDVGGNKFPALVRAGHRVTVALPRHARRVAGLGYGPLPEGVELRPEDGHRVVTFIACGRDEPSGSTADGEPVTFWSGFVLTAEPRCVPLDIWVDDEPRPRHAALPMGARCDEEALAKLLRRSRRSIVELAHGR